jgi:hypothetical protein
VLKCAHLFDQIEVILPLKSNKEMTCLQWANKQVLWNLMSFMIPGNKKKKKKQEYYE